MPTLASLLWTAGFVQIAISAANLYLPAKLKRGENLERVAPIIRQIFFMRAFLHGDRGCVFDLSLELSPAQQSAKGKIDGMKARSPTRFERRSEAS